MSTRADAVRIGRTWIGTPFVAGQALRGHGADCWGVVLGTGRELGSFAADFDVGPYKQMPDGRMRALCDRYLDPIAPGTEQAGDILLMKGEQQPQHLAIVVPYVWGGLAVLHALTVRGRTVEHRLDARWRGFIVASYAFPGIE